MNSRYLQIDNRHLFVWLAIMFILSFAGQTQREEETEDGSVVWRCSPLFAFLIFLPVFLMAVRGVPRSDTYLYLNSFRELPSSISAGWQELLLYWISSVPINSYCQSFILHTDIDFYITIF